MSLTWPGIVLFFALQESQFQKRVDTLGSLLVVVATLASLSLSLSLRESKGGWFGGEERVGRCRRRQVLDGCCSMWL